MKSQAPTSPTFSKVCVSIGQLSHSTFTRINVLASGYKFVGVKPLERDDALNKGVDIISEFMVILASGTIIVVEVCRLSICHTRESLSF